MTLRPLSIRLRLALWNSGLLALLLFFGGLSLWEFFSFSLQRQADASLRSKLDSFTAAFAAHRGRMEFESIDDEKLQGPSPYCPSGVVFQASDEDGRAFLRSDNLKQLDLPLTRTMREVADRGRVSFETGVSSDLYAMRVATTKAALGNGSNYYLQAGLCEQADDALLGKLTLGLLLATLIILAAGTGVGVLLVGRALRPVRTLAQQARGITLDRLDQRVAAVETQDEIGLLSATLNEMLERLQKSAAQIMQFTGDASHELKTPLTIIRGEAETTLAEPREAEDYQCALRSIVDEADRMALIVDDLLVLSRMDAGEEASNFKTVRLDLLLVDVHEHAKALASTKGQSVELAACPRAAVHGHELRLRQLLLNLVDNAVRYTQEGGSLSLALRVRDAFAELEVADDGIGIPPEALPYIFDRFFRVDKARSRETGGTGLGLAICKQIVAAHRGTIAVSSAVQKGSRFTVRLPLLTTSS